MLCRAAALGASLAVLVTAAPVRADDARVRARDHVQLRIDYLELADTDAPIEISVRVDGKTAWARRFSAAPMYAGLGPVVGAPGARFNVTVSRLDGDEPVVAAALTLTDSGKDATKTFARGGVKKLIVSTRGIDVWAVPELQVAVLSRLTDRDKKRVKSALLALNRRVVDVSDGHVRIDRFVVYGAPIPDGVTADLHIGKCEGECPRAVGRPAKPAAIRVAGADADALSRAFGHAYLGVPAGESCFGADVEPTDEDQDDEPFDCRGAVTTALRDDLGIALGATTFDGPPPHRLPDVTFADDTIDLGADDTETTTAPPDGKTVDAVVARYADGLGKCLRDAKATSATIKLSIRGADGRLMSVKVDGNRTGAIVDCVTAALAKARFPRSKSNRVVVEFRMTQ